MRNRLAFALPFAWKAVRPPMEWGNRRQRPRVFDGPFIDPSLFPWASSLEAQAGAINSEMMGLFGNWEWLQPIAGTTEYQGRIGVTGWDLGFIYAFGIWRPGFASECPETFTALSSIPNLRLAFISSLAAGAHIPCHRGLYNSFIRCHLGLHVPHPRLAHIRVSGELAHWERGRLLAFDDSRVHEVWNEASEERVVLVFDVELDNGRFMNCLNGVLVRILKNTPYVKTPLAALR